MKVIYYCWFGRNPLTKEIKEYIRTWETFFPEYEIIEINENNFDVEKYQYAKDAYVAKKYAFVSDCARVDFLEETGGIYFDTDVEVVRNFEKLLPQSKTIIFAMEKLGIDITGLSTAVIMSTAHHPFLKAMQKYYESTPFDNVPEPQTINETMNRILEKETDFKFRDKEQKLIYEGENIQVYPSNTFMRNTTNAYAIHHLDGSWTEKMTITRKMRRFFGIIVKRIIGRKRFNKLWKK